MSIELKVRGSFQNVQNWLNRLGADEHYMAIDKLAQRGVDALSSATPKDTGTTAASWTYRIKMDRGAVSIAFLNYNKTETGIPIVILLDYGHATGNGGYVKGKRFIDSTIQPIMDEIAEQVWAEICR